MMNAIWVMMMGALYVLGRIYMLVSMARLK